MLIIEGDLGRISKALRIVRGDVVFYSEHSSRMKRRNAFVVTTDPSDTGINLAAVQYFILHHATNKCLAVIRPLQIHIEYTILSELRRETPKRESDPC